MIGFLVFLLIVLAAGFIYLTFESRWKKPKRTKVNIAQKINKVAHVGAGGKGLTFASVNITSGTIENATKIDVSNAPKLNLNGAVIFEETYNGDLPKSAQRVNQVHMERRMFERPRRKVKR